MTFNTTTYTGTNTGQATPDMTVVTPNPSQLGGAALNTNFKAIGDALASIAAQLSTLAGQIGDAATAAVNAQDSANTAQSSANHAEDTAETAESLANTAQSSANHALQPENNLSDVNNAATARTNLGLGNVTNALQLVKSNNLSDVANVGAARANLGLGIVAQANVVNINNGGTSATTAAAARTALGVPATSDLANYAPIASPTFTGTATIAGAEITGDLQLDGVLKAPDGATILTTVNSDFDGGVIFPGGVEIGPGFDIVLYPDTSNGGLSIFAGGAIQTDNTAFQTDGNGNVTATSFNGDGSNLANVSATYFSGDGSGITGLSWDQLTNGNQSDWNLSGFNNDANFATLGASISAFTNDIGYLTGSDVSNAALDHTITSDGSGQLTAAQFVGDFNGTVNGGSDLVGYAPSLTVGQADYVGWGGVEGAPNFVEIGDGVSSLSNDAGYMQNGQTNVEFDGTSISSDSHGNLTAVSFVGSGASLTNIPESAVTNLTTDLAAKLPTAWVKNARLASDQTITATSPTGITGMSFAIGANEEWTAEFEWVVTATTTTNFSLTGPASPSALLWRVFVPTVLTSKFTTYTSFSSLTGTTYNIFRITVAVKNGSTAGTVAFNAYNTTGSSNITLASGSYMTARRLA